jgi:signal transduction histidine kinase
MPSIDFLAGLSRRSLKATGYGLVLAIAVADWLSGNQISASAIYAIPIAFATWLVGWRFGLTLAICSVALWVGSELYVERPSLAIVANAVIKVAGYGVFIALLTGLHNYQQNLQRRIQDRTAALVRQITERERLERELLSVSEREQRRIGQDLHDSLCQHLTGTALAAQSLAEKLAARDVPDAGAAHQLVELVADAISQARNLAKGLNPVEMHSDGLMEALDEFASSTSQLFKISCSFACDYPVLIGDAGAAGQLYRIAQEAVSNAIKHGQATRVAISLDEHEDGAVLSVHDNGIGFPETLPGSDGMGLRIMSHRAKVIGASLDIQRNPAGGTTVVCTFPPDPRMEEVGHA